MSDALIPGTVLQQNTGWLATSRLLLPEPRLPQDEAPTPTRAGRLAHVLSGLSRTHRPAA